MTTSKPNGESQRIRTLYAYRLPDLDGWTVKEGPLTPQEVPAFLSKQSIVASETRILDSGHATEEFPYTAWHATERSWFKDPATDRWYAPDEVAGNLPPPPICCTSDVMMWIAEIQFGGFFLCIRFDGADVRLIFENTGGDLVSFVQLIHRLKAGGGGHALIDNHGSLIEFHAHVDAKADQLRVVARGVHDARHVLLNLLTPRRHGVNYLLSCIYALANDAYFARHFLCHASMDHERSEQVGEIADRDWAQGVADGRYDKDDFDLQRRMDVWATVRDVPLSAEEAEYVGHWKRFLKTGNLPPELQGIWFPAL